MPSSTPRLLRRRVERFFAALGVPDKALVLVAVSGGQDSVCLLDALQAALPNPRAHLLVVHLNHGLRGPASQADAVLTLAHAERLGLEYLEVGADVQAYASRHSIGLEQAGRNLRYQALLGVGLRRQAWAVATGHTQDDLAETLLLNILRGAGSLGIAGIQPLQSLRRAVFGPTYPELGFETPPDAELRFVRPLLDTTRVETETYCTELGLEFRRDESNQDPSFTRNRLRHHLLPLLSTYNPAINASLARLATLTADDEVELEQLAARFWVERPATGNGLVEITWDDWLSLSPAMQRRVLRRAAAHLLIDGGWSFQSIEDTRRLLAGRPARSRLALAGGVRLTTSRQGFKLVRADRGDP